MIISTIDLLLCPYDPCTTLLVFSFRIYHSLYLSIFNSPYKSKGRAIAVITALALALASALLKMLKFLVIIFKSLYFLNLWMDLVDILPDVR